VISLKAQGYGINAHEVVGYNTPSYYVVHDVKVKGNPRVIVNRPAVRKMRSDLSSALLGAIKELRRMSKKAPTFREEMNCEKHIYTNGVKYIEEQKGK